MLVIKIVASVFYLVLIKKMEDKTYFDAYEKEISNNPEAIRCIYEYLKNFDIEKVVPYKIFASAKPKSEMYKELHQCNKDKNWVL